MHDFIGLPAAARAEYWHDRQERAVADPGLLPTVLAMLGWLGRAQDLSASADGGVARHFSLLSGWSTSYPETTGYIVPTMFDAAERFSDDGLRERGRRMLDWLVALQRTDGGFQGGTIGQQPVVSVTFNTGQILIGLARGVRELGDAYRQPMRRAARHLVESQDADGCWRRFPTPFAAPGEKSYETHVSWGLFEAARVEEDADEARRYVAAARRNVSWALGAQRENGWFEKCCLMRPSAPLTHTIGYVLRGVLEAYRYTGDQALLAAAIRTADGVLRALRPDGALPGRLDDSWRGVVPWVCLTGSAQIAHCWLLLYGVTGEPRYRDAAYATNRYVRSTVRLDGPASQRGGVKGSFPVNGDYGRYEYLNWAAKFLIDSCLLEEEVRAGDQEGAYST